MREGEHEMQERRKLSGVEKVLSFVAPERAFRRMVAREKIHEFAAVRQSTARGKLATVFDQGSSESWKKQRERIDAMWEGREMEENFCIIAGLLQKLGIYICGQLEYQPETGDNKIDHQYDEFFHDWCGRADVSGRHRFRTLVQLGLQSAIRDGQHGWREHVVNGELRLQPIEGDRIGNPLNPNNADDTNINGIRIDDKGRVVAYEIYKRTRTLSYTLEGEITPNEFIHLFFPNRSDQYHGVSKLAPALPHARDLCELLGYPLTRHGYQLDSLGRRTATTQIDGSTWTWGYNDRSEVTSSHRFERDATQPPAAHVEVPPFAANYAFDDIGHRTSSTSPILGSFSYTANALNQYAAITTSDYPATTNPTRAVVGTAPAGDVTINSATATRINSIFFGDASATYSANPLWLDASVVSGSQTVHRSVFVPAPSVTPVYDDDGNLCNDGRWTYVWDAENRLVEMETVAATETTAIPPAISHPHRKLTFAYDWTGHRLSRKVFGPGDTLISDTRWLWDGWNPVAEYSGTTLTKSYVWGLDLSGTLQGAGGVGGLLSATTHNSPSATFYPSSDGNGNITAWTKSGESQATCRREYDAFGNVVVEQGTPPCGFGFSTKIEDAETGLLYYDLRYLQPPTGRWLSVDPADEEGGVNLYGFVVNDGVDDVDNIGLNAVVVSTGINVDLIRVPKHDNNWRNYITAAELRINELKNTLKEGEQIEWLVEINTLIGREMFDKSHFNIRRPFFYFAEDDVYLNDVGLTAQRLGVKLRVYTSKREFVTAVNSEPNGMGRNGASLITSFTFYGHGDPGNLWLNINNRTFDLTAKDIKSGLLQVHQMGM